MEEEDERHGWKSGDASNMAIGAAADGYRNRTTRRSKALKGTAQGVHQLAQRASEVPYVCVCFPPAKKRGK